MKLKEAREIVGKMVGWLMVNQGIISPGDKQFPEPITEDLITLLKANAMVESANKRSERRAEKKLRETGKSFRRSIKMTIADRGIAALYVAIKFAPQNPNFGKMDTLAYYNGGAVLCITCRLNDGEEDEEDV